LAYTLRNVDAAAQIGTSVLCVGLHRPLTPAQQAALCFGQSKAKPTGSTTPGRGHSRSSDRWAVGSYAAQVGINISLEMNEDTYLGTADSAVALVTDIDLPNVGLNPDIANIIRLHRPIENWEDMHLNTLAHSNYWHIKKYFRDYDPDTGAYFSAPALAKDGLISYRRALEIALDNGFSGPICVEHYGGDGLSVAASNRDYLRRTLAVKLGH
jgi:sugar phosphate isomerase/epimerase